MSKTKHHTSKKDTAIKKLIHREYASKSRTYYKKICKKLLKNPEEEIILKTKEKDLGYLCNRCIKGLESREGPLTFEED